MSHLIWNPILREYLTDASHRMNRREGVTTCPFCADTPPAGCDAYTRPNDFPPLQPPAGESQILVYSRTHEQSFASLYPEQIGNVVALWLQVYHDLSSRYPAVMIFENSGEEIGQTQHHPHGQVYGVSQLPPRLQQEWSTVESAGACPFCAVLQTELAGPRLVAQTADWVVFLPLYARYPYELHLYPRVHAPDIVRVANVGEFGMLVQRIVRVYNALFDRPMPYMMGLHQMADPRFHFHVEFLPTRRSRDKLKLPASSESLWGLWINDSDPNEKAAELRRLLEQQT